MEETQGTYCKLGRAILGATGGRPGAVFVNLVSVDGALAALVQGAGGFYEEVKLREDYSVGFTALDKETVDH